MPTYIFILTFCNGTTETHQAKAHTEKEAWKLVWNELDSHDQDMLEEFDCVDVMTPVDL